MTGARASQVWAWDPLKMELDMLVSVMWVLGTASWASAGASSALVEQRPIYILKVAALESLRLHSVGRTHG